MAFDGALTGTRAVNFLDVQFSGLDLDAALDAVSVRASLDLPFTYVATPDVEHIVGLSSEPARYSLYDGAWLTLNGSNILRSLAARVGFDLPVVAGADLAERLFARVIDRHEGVTIIGGNARMIAELKRRYGLTDVRWHQPPKDLTQKPASIVRAAAFAATQRTRFTFLCVGAPQQELIAYAMAKRGDATGVGLCVGAALEARSSRTVLLQRLASAPQRLWRRYLVTGPKVSSLFAEWRAAMAAASAA